MSKSPREMYKDFNETEAKFARYGIRSFNYNDIFSLIYRKLDNIQDTIIICSYLKEMNIPMDIIKEVYSVDDEYINNLLSNTLPSIRVDAYKRLRDEIPNIKVLFFPDMKPNLEPLYIDFLDRLEYIFEVRRNQRKLRKELYGKDILPKLINNSSLLAILNYFSVKESIILASNLDLLDIDEEEIQKLYPHTEEDFKKIFSSSNITSLVDLLSKRIEKLANIDEELSYFDYEGLLESCDDLFYRIEDTREYFNKGNKSRK